MGDLTPEAIVELPPRPWTPSSQFQILSDNGRTDFYNDGTQAKHLPELNFRKFRSDVAALGTEASPEPFLTSITALGGGMVLQWRSNPGDRCRVQYKEKLTDMTWNDLAGEVTATGLLCSKTNTASLPSQRFYQVMLVP